LEEGKRFFEGKEGKSFAGIILDVLCSQKEGELELHSSFITAANSYFDKNAPHIPRVILTGEPDQYKGLKDLYKDTMNVYSKSVNENEMFDFLFSEAQKSDYVKIVNKYAVVFDVFEKDYLDCEAEQELIDCIKNMKSADFTVSKNTLGCLRRLQEKIYIAINRNDPKMVPAEFIEKGVNVRSIIYHLTEKGYVDRYSIIDKSAMHIYSIASNNGAHTPYESSSYKPTKYTVQSIVFAMMDLLLWLKEVMESHKNTGTA